MREAGTGTPQVVLVAHLPSIRLERFDAMRVGRLRAATMRDIEKLAMILLAL